MEIFLKLMVELLRFLISEKQGYTAEQLKAMIG